MEFLHVPLNCSCFQYPRGMEITAQNPTPKAGNPFSPTIFCVASQATGPVGDWVECAIA